MCRKNIMRYMSPILLHYICTRNISSLIAINKYTLFIYQYCLTEENKLIFLGLNFDIILISINPITDFFFNNARKYLPK